MKKIITTLCLMVLFLGVFMYIFFGDNKADDNAKIPNDTNQNETENGNKTDKEEVPFDYDLSEYVELGDLSKATYDQATVDVYIAQTKGDIASEYAVKTEIKDRPVQKTDSVNLDFEGKIDGKVFEGGSAKEYDLVIGSGNFIPGFEDGIIGKNIGDKFDLDLTFPKDYHSKDLAGKAVVFTVTINKIHEVKVPDLTDEMIEKLGTEHKTIEAFEEYLKGYYSEMLLWENYVASCKINKLPEKEVNQVYDQEIAYYQSIASYYKITLDEYAKSGGLADEKALREVVRKSAEESVGMMIITYHTARTNEITISDEEYKEGAGILAKEYGLTSVESLEEQYGKSAIMVNLYQKKIVKTVMAEKAE